MEMHKRMRLTPLARQEIWEKWSTAKVKKVTLAQTCSTATFLKQVIDECPYTIECVYSDNGTEFKGTLHHAFVRVATDPHIAQKFTRPARPQTNGKAERVIRTLMEMGRDKIIFVDRRDRQISLIRFVNFYNTVKPHASLDNAISYEKLRAYFNLTQNVKNARASYRLSHKIPDSRFWSR